MKILTMTERLSHTINILEKVSFSKDLFIKEVNKAIDFYYPLKLINLKNGLLILQKQNRF